MGRVRIGFAIGVIFVLVGAASSAGASDELVIPVDSVIRGRPGEVIEVASVAVDADLVGLTCAVRVTWENNPSVHPDNDLIITTAGVDTVVADVESEPEQVTRTVTDVEMGANLVVAMRLGPDGVSSGGMDLGFDCAPPTTVSPTTEVAVSTTTTAPPTVSTTVVEESTTTTTEAEVNVQRRAIVAAKVLPRSAPSPAVAAQPTYTG